MRKATPPKEVKPIPEGKEYQQLLEGIESYVHHNLWGLLELISGDCVKIGNNMIELNKDLPKGHGVNLLAKQWLTIGGKLSKIADSIE
jgi:hypothetical protein